MAMAGLRDLAIIATPPAHRLAVQTFVAPWDDAQLREPSERELARGGPVYFLHNDVESIGRMQRQLSRSEEHTSELQSLMRISYAVFCLKKKQILSSSSSTYHHIRHLRSI